MAHRLIVHPNVPPGLVAHLQTLNDLECDKALIERSDCSPAWLAAKAQEPDLRPAVAAHSNTPAAVLLDMAKQQDSNIHMAMLRGSFSWERGSVPGPHLDIDTLKLLTRSPDAEVRKMAMARLPVESRPDGTKIKPTELAALVAQPDCSSEFVVLAAQHANPKLRLAAFNHPNCPTEVAIGLCDDWDHNIKAAAARRPYCPPEILRSLAHYGDKTIRWQCANNPSCPPDVQMQLLQSGTADEKRALAANPGLTPEVATQLVQSRDILTREAILKNPACPEHIRAILRLGR